MDQVNILKASEENVAQRERIGSVIGGLVVLGAAIARRSAITPILTLLGGALIRRGITGKCPVYQKLGVNTARPHDSV